MMSGCYLVKGKDKKGREYQWLQHLSTMARPEFMLNLGDQMYIDTYRKKNKFYSAEEYVERYLETWSHHNTKVFRAHLPQYMIWDDHEIYNNFYHLTGEPGVDPEYVEKSEKCFEEAAKVYELFSISTIRIRRRGGIIIPSTAPLPVIL